MDSTIPIFKNKKITVFLSIDLVRCMIKLAEKKIRHEGWEGRNINVKVFNFLQSWVSEEAFKDLLGENKVKYQHRGYYVGPVESATASDFVIWRNQRATTIGIRNRFLCQLEKYRELPYPNDRLIDEPEKISEYIILSSIDVNPVGTEFGVGCSFRPFSFASEFLDAVVDKEAGIPISFYGAIPRKDFIDILMKIKPRSSSSNQELFRAHPTKHFEFDLLTELIEKSEKRFHKK